MSKLQAEEYKYFEEIKKVKDDGTEYWSARELSKVLQYTEWRNFSKVIDRAKLACKNSTQEISNHFVEVNKMIKLAKNATKNVIDYELSRYACYLIVQNGDPRKEIIALGQTYFAIQTRRQEVASNEKILDFMGSTELIANLFRISQTEEKLKKDNIHSCNKATSTHYEVGSKVRKAIEDIGGTMPEDLPTPKKSIKEIEKEQLNRLKNTNKKLMLDE